MVSASRLTQNPPGRVGILTGATATGKTALALALADQARTPVEIINADSLLVYKGMDIGTAKPSPEERARIPHHLIDIRNPGESYTAGDFSRDAAAKIAEIEARGHRALVVGGTGFYLKALTHGIWQAPPANPEIRARLQALPAVELLQRLERVDPDSALRIGQADRYRLVRALEIFEQTGRTPTELQQEHRALPDSRFALWIIDRDTDELHRRIDARTGAMIDAGLVDETRRIAEACPEARALSSVGYAQTLAHIQGIQPRGRKMRPGLEGLRDEIALATRQLVKQQRTWFKGQHPERQVFLLDRELEPLKKAFLSLYG